MSKRIFSHTDTDGDWLVAEQLEEADDAAVFVWASPDGASLDADAVTRLRAALKPFDPMEPAEFIEDGREYRLLPGSRNYEGETWMSRAGVTRVRVVGGPDSYYGEYRVVALDGNEHRRCSECGESHGGIGWVYPRYLAPILSDRD